jgi:hypothetical protein
MFRGEVGVCIINVLQKLVEVGNIRWIEILSTFWIQIPRPGCTDLGMALLEPVDPVQARNNAANVEHEGSDAVSVKRLCNGSLVVDPIQKCRLLSLGKDLLVLVCLLLVHTSTQAIPQRPVRNLMI